MDNQKVNISITWAGLLFWGGIIALIIGAFKYFNAPEPPQGQQKEGIKALIGGAIALTIGFVLSKIQKNV